MRHCLEGVIAHENYGEARKWFDDVGEALRALSIPYGVIYRALDVQNVFEEAAFCNKRLNELPENEKTGVANYLRKLNMSAPQPEIYAAIREEIAASAVSQIRQAFPASRSAIVLGDPLGDIDIGLILEREDRRRIEAGSRYFEELYRLRWTYPLIDVFALDYFRSASGKELAEKLVQAHCEAYDKKEMQQLDTNEMLHLKESVENSWLLYGKKQDYLDFLHGVTCLLIELRNVVGGNGEMPPGTILEID